MTRRRSERELERTVDRLDGGPSPRPITLAELIAAFEAEAVEPAPGANCHRVGSELVTVPPAIRGVLADLVDRPEETVQEGER